MKIISIRLLVVLASLVFLASCGSGGSGSSDASSASDETPNPGSGSSGDANGDTGSGGDDTGGDSQPVNCSVAGIELNDLMAREKELDSAVESAQAAIDDQEQKVEEACADGNTPDSDGETNYTFLGPLKGLSGYENYKMPVYRTPQDGWAMIEDMCGPVGTWDHEIVVNHGDEPGQVVVRNTNGCVHIKGVPGPNGELPEFNIGGPKVYRGGELRRGGLYVENIKSTSFAVPNDQYFFVMHNVHLEGWGNHAFITQAGAKHLFVEIKDSYFGYGNNNHAAYIDNVAYANVENSVFESPGRQHAFRSIAQRGRYVGNKFCNIQCDGTILQHSSGRRMIGSPPFDIYTNGAHIVKDNKIVYYRPSNQVFQAANFRSRPDINTLDRYDDGTDEYNYLVWGSEEYNDPETWEKMPMIETMVENLEIECLGTSPCMAFSISSTYPYYHYQNGLIIWWTENKFRTWEELLENSHPSWHDMLNLMTPSYREEKIEDEGRGLPWSMPMSVPDVWQQKARIVLQNVHGNFTKLYEPVSDTAGNWCLGEMSNGSCKNQRYYKQAEVVVQ